MTRRENRARTLRLEPRNAALVRGVGPSDPPRRNPRYTRLNDMLGYYVAASAILTAVPVGLNRPVLWLSWTCLTALVTMLYLWRGRRLQPGRRLLSARHGLLFALALTIPLYAVIQAIPGLGHLVAATLVPEEMRPATISLLPEASAMAALRFTGYILFAALAIEVGSRADRAHKIAWWIFWGVVAHAVFGLVALNALGDVTLWGAAKISSEGSATGTFVSRNNFATYLAMGGILGMALLYERKDRPQRRRARTSAWLTQDHVEYALIALGIVAIAAALLSTQSRAGVAAAALGAGVCFLLMRWKGGISVWRAILALVAFVGVGLAISIPIYGQELVNRYLFLAINADQRIEGYIRVVSLIEARPMTGVGFDAFRPAYEIVHTAPFSLDRIWDRAHSTILSNWAELGLIMGSVPLLLGLLVAGRLFGTIWRRNQDYGIGVAGMAVLVLIGAHSLVDFSMEIPAVVILVLAILGLGIAHRTPAAQKSRR